MKCPSGYNEQQILDILKTIGNVLSGSFAFGYYSKEDIRQQIYLYGLEILEKDSYKPSQGKLDSFLYISIRNRLTNLTRLITTRGNPPCLSCHQGDPCEDACGPACAKYQAWVDRNNSKRTLMCPQDITLLDEEDDNLPASGNIVEDAALSSEVLEAINKAIPARLRVTYLKMRDGVEVPKALRAEVEEIVRKELAPLCLTED